MIDHEKLDLLERIEMLETMVNDLRWRMNQVCNKLSMDEVTTKKGLRVGQEVYYVLDDAPAPGIITSQQGCMYTLGFDEVLISENDLYPTRESLIDAQIEHWQGMLESKASCCSVHAGSDEECEHESDSKIKPYKCKKCGEFYR